MPVQPVRPLRRIAIFLLALLVPALSQAGTQARPDEQMRRQLVEAINSSNSFQDRFDAEVWLTDMSSRLGNRVESRKEALRILRLAHREARRAGLPPELVLAVINVESNFDRFAISNAGAEGLMQVMPFWLDEIGHPDDNLFDIGTNLRLGCTILKLYLKREHGNMHRALARYNGSIGEHWYPQRVFKALRTTWYSQ
jgi:soluble lytic murein transglycosylase-like protein